jgi:hypothetical protein
MRTAGFILGIIVLGAPLVGVEASAKRLAIFPHEDLELYSHEGSEPKNRYLDLSSSLLPVHDTCFAGLSPLALSYLAVEASLSCRYRFAGLMLAPRVAPGLRYDNRRHHLSLAAASAFSASYRLPPPSLHLVLVSSLSYQWSARPVRESVDTSRFDSGIFQYYHDVLSTFFSMGLIYYPQQIGSDQGWLLEYYSSLPGLIRKFGRVGVDQSSSFSWLRLHYRREYRSVIWGLGLGYGRFRSDPIVVQGVFPSVSLAYLF